MAHSTSTHSPNSNQKIMFIVSTKCGKSEVKDNGANKTAVTTIEYALYTFDIARIKP